LLSYLICSYMRRLAIQNSLKCTGTLQIFIDPHWCFILDTGLILRSIELFIYIQTCENVNAYTICNLKNRLWTTIALFHFCSLIWGLTNNNYRDRNINPVSSIKHQWGSIKIWSVPVHFNEFWMANLRIYEHIRYDNYDFMSQKN
jgi:hypothetical protein